MKSNNFSEIFSFYSLLISLSNFLLVRRKAKHSGEEAPYHAYEDFKNHLTKHINKESDIKVQAIFRDEYEDEVMSAYLKIEANRLLENNDLTDNDNLFLKLIITLLDKDGLFSLANKN